ncbi:MAG: hypothetical protein ACPGVU_14600, partial [Limisphaerales bacterium]
FTAGTNHAADPFTFKAPKDWRSERIPFPLGFAPELKYTGFEELRFGPGMFQPKSDTYWTYVFFWWIDGDIKLTKEQMEKDFDNYYRGLSRAVGSRKFTIDTNKVSSSVTAVVQKNLDDPNFTGTLTTYDAFATGRLVKLNLEISRRHYAKLNRTFYFFAVSPKPRTEPVWKEMRRIGNSFKVK